YLLLADFDAYCRAQERAGARYRDQRAWNRSALLNIARSGVFAADRAVSQYAENIWNVPHRR
ncbi:MAG TPA: glycogen/starch/alpha-glucan phosphorylase, partial [Oscillospiraceae bacterium]|nr:glycogen/starch/alpha-glucan phosphorylase [Oscillospiraceae bacterium]